MTVRVVGVDCATEAAEVGLAAGHVDDRGVLTLDEVERGSGRGSLASALAPRIRDLLGELPQAVLALDAPLGWPRPLAEALTVHRAGVRLGVGGAANRYFHRRTDDVVREHTTKIPLEVGANFIARTAFIALELLHALREHPADLPLIWNANTPRSPGVIEVYPAATLLARGLSPKKYKSRDVEERAVARRKIIDTLRTEIAVDEEMEGKMLASDHVLDAVLCCLGAADFLAGNVVVPNDLELELAHTEGWIWFKPPAPLLAHG